MSDHNAIANLVNDMEIGDVSEFISMFMYQGFNPEMVHAHFAHIKHKKAISNEHFIADLRSLVIVGVMMGNYNDHNAGKISESGKSSADSLYVKYELHKGAVGVNKKAVTLPRILAAFPVVTIRITLKCSPRNYNGVFGANALPHAMKTQVFPSVIPHTLNREITTVLLLASACYTTEQTITISNLKTNPVEVIKDQMKYTEVSFNSSVPSERERQAIFKTLHLQHDSIASVVQQYAKLTGVAVSMPSHEAFQAAGIHST